MEDLKKGEGAHADDAEFCRSDGTRFDVTYYAHPRYKNGELTGAVITFLDISTRKKAESEIIYLSYHDSLTGLYNRRFFEEEVKRIDIAKNLPISVIMGDVNGLKLTNDIYGHDAGDRLLCKAAEIIKKGTRASDVVARLGGDEYIIILPRTSYEDAKKITERIKNFFYYENIKAFNCSISLGCDTKISEDESLAKVIESAEERMYVQKVHDRKVINSDTIKSIIETLHQCNNREESHATNVGKLCYETGRAMKLTESEIKRLRDAGFLHDIGKTVLNNDLLNKKELTDYELQEIRQHPVIGYRILNSFEETMELAKYILSHHERWDGKGYPKGLKGEQIPKLARIIAIAESYDAMANDLTYKKPMTKEEALAEIQNNAGTQFDPDIVKVFVEIVMAETKSGQ